MNEEEILRELNNLPRGYISKKRINGNDYSYLQYLDAGKLRSQYIREDELNDYVQGIERRKQLEQELKDIDDSMRNAPILSRRARSLTGTVRSGDIVVAEFQDGEMVDCDPELAPLMLLRTGNLVAFLASRAIDSSRTNSRLIKKVMDIHGEPDEMVSLYAHGATITDNFWFRAKGSRLRYADIRFDNDAYNEIALDGKILIYKKKSKLSPQLTLGGSYEKCWRLIDGEWWLYKRGSHKEIYSELLSPRIAELLGIPTASYEYADGNIRTKDFTSGYNYEPMTSIAGDDDGLNHVFESLASLRCKNKDEIIDSYLRLLFLDAVVNNVDRHNENCGLIRDLQTGEIISLAPNFDNNLSLISRGKELIMDPKHDGLMDFLMKFVRRNSEARARYKRIVALLPIIDIVDVANAITSVDNELKPTVLCPDVDREQLARYITERYRYLVSKLQ